MNNKTRKLLIAGAIAVFLGSKIFNSSPKSEYKSEFVSDHGKYLHNLRKNG